MICVGFFPETKIGYLALGVDAKHRKYLEWPYMIAIYKLKRSCVCLLNHV